MSHDKKNSNFILNLILQNKNLKINFLIIIEDNKIKNVIYKLFDNILKYIEDKRYIKFFNKNVIGINKSSFKKENIMILREEFKKRQLIEIFILSLTYNYKYIKNNSNNNNGFCYSPEFHFFQKVKFHYNKAYVYFYTHLVCNNLLKPPLNI